MNVQSEGNEGVSMIKHRRLTASRINELINAINVDCMKMLTRGIKMLVITIRKRGRTEVGESNNVSETNMARSESPTMTSM